MRSSLTLQVKRNIMNKIPFSKPYITPLEHKYANQALDAQMLSGDRDWTKRCTELLESAFNVQKLLLTTSCSTALDMTALLLELKEGDEVIMPSYNFVSMANSVVVRGATPVFVDIDPKTLIIDLDEVEKHITTRTKAVYPVHYAGISCDMDRLLAICGPRHIAVVEDAAQGVHAKYKDRYLGTIGDMGCYSFHETKNYTCGEGGAILLNKNTELMERAEIIREKGTNRSQFFRGQIDKYTWVDIGSSFLPSDLLAALLCAQIENREENLRRRKAAYDYYCKELAPLAGKYDFSLPMIPAYSQSNYHIFYLMMRTGEERDGLMRFLNERGISACFHYIPLHSSPFGRLRCQRGGEFPVTDWVSERILRLPLYCELESRIVEYIVESIADYYGSRG